MIQYHEGVPFCIMQPEEAGVNIDCKRIVEFLEHIEPQICSEMPINKDTA